MKNTILTAMVALATTMSAQCVALQTPNGVVRGAMVQDGTVKFGGGLFTLKNAVVTDELIRGRNSMTQVMAKRIDSSGVVNVYECKFSGSDSFWYMYSAPTCGAISRYATSLGLNVKIKK